MTPDLAGSLRAAAGALAKARSIVVLGHVGPDGDALGSSLALALAARNAGKDAVATFGEPFVVGGQYRFLADDLLVAPAAVTHGVDLAVACDTANLERLGSAAAIAQSAAQVLVIDHHVSNSPFGDVTLIDPTAAATAQLVYHLLAELEWRLTPDIATALYTGLVTDTGRFQYSSTTPEVHRIAAELLAAGVEPDHVSRHIYEESPFGYLHLAAAVLARAQLDEEVSLVWSTLHQSDLAAAAIGYEDADGLINLIRIAREAEVSCLLRELDQGKIKGSLRSRGGVDVNVVAGALGGGGHHNAAGFTFTGSAEDAISRVRAALL